MLFSEKMTATPQPRRAELWREYRTLCRALSLRVRLNKEGRAPTEDEVAPLRDAAERANRILEEQGMEPSFFPAEPNFFALLLQELDALMKTPSNQD